LVFFGEQGTGFPDAVRGTPEGRGNGKMAGTTDEEGRDVEGTDEVGAFSSPVIRVNVLVEESLPVRFCCPTTWFMKEMKDRIVMRINERRRGW